jgi:hypothetical protein
VCDVYDQGASIIKNGSRLLSQVCDTQVIVVRSANSLDAA